MSLKNCVKRIVDKTCEVLVEWDDKSEGACHFVAAACLQPVIPKATLQGGTRVVWNSAWSGVIVQQTPAPKPDGDAEDDVPLAHLLALTPSKILSDTRSHTASKPLQPIQSPVSGTSVTRGSPPACSSVNLRPQHSSHDVPAGRIESKIQRKIANAIVNRQGKPTTQRPRRAQSDSEYVPSSDADSDSRSTPERSPTLLADRSFIRATTPMPEFDPFELPSDEAEAMFNALDADDVAQSSVSSEGPVGKRSRRRKRNPEMWKRNVIRDAYQQGLTHPSPMGIIPGKSAAVDINLCGVKTCRFNCDILVSNDSRQSIFDHFYSLDAESKQAFLFGCLKKCAVKRRKVHPEQSEASERSGSWQYLIKVDGEETRVCQKAVCTLLGVSKKRFERLRSVSHGPSPIQRGHHANRPNRIPVEVREMVKAHIASFPAEASHYSRHKNPHRRYLDSNLTVTKMHDLFNEQQGGQNLPKVKESYYRDVFINEFNLGFGTPRSDTCGVCDTKAEGWEAHKEAADVALLCMCADRSRASTDKSVLYITFDLQKTLPLPRLTVTQAFYLRQLWFYNMGIHAVSVEFPSGRGYMYNWTENQHGRGPKEVGSSIVAFSEERDVSGYKHLVAWSDSCGGQNKNFYIMCLWQYFIHSGRFSVVEHKFPVVGHSRLDSDRDFGLIEKCVRKEENLYTAEEYRDLIKNTRRKDPFRVTDIGNGMVDVKKLPGALKLVRRARNTDKQPIKFKDVRWIRIDSFGTYKYRMTFDENEPWKTVDMKHQRPSDVVPVDLNKLSVQPANAVQRKKWNDLQSQLQYLPRIARAFYSSIAPIDSRDEESDCD